MICCKNVVDVASLNYYYLFFGFNCREMLCSQQILSSRLLLVVMVGKKVIQVVDSN